MVRTSSSTGLSGMSAWGSGRGVMVSGYSQIDYSHLTTSPARRFEVPATGSDGRKFDPPDLAKGIVRVEVSAQTLQPDPCRRRMADDLATAGNGTLLHRGDRVPHVRDRRD